MVGFGDKLKHYKVETICNKCGKYIKWGKVTAHKKKCKSKWGKTHRRIK